MVLGFRKNYHKEVQFELRLEGEGVSHVKIYQRVLPTEETAHVTALWWEGAYLLQEKQFSECP